MLERKPKWNATSFSSGCMSSTVLWRSTYPDSVFALVIAGRGALVLLGFSRGLSAMNDDRYHELVCAHESYRREYQPCGD